MEITDKNTIIYNLYKKIECLEQALTISKQRMNAQLNEIQVKTKELRIYLILSIFFMHQGSSIENFSDYFFNLFFKINHYFL